MANVLHIGDEVLVRLALGERQPTPAERRHLERCPSCEGRLAATRRISAVLEEQVEMPSPEAFERAAERIDSMAPAAEVPAELVAELRPGASLEAPAGLRSAAPATQQWLLRAGDLEVDLQAFSEGPEARRLHGQILSRSGAAAGLPVHVRHGGNPQMAVTDRLGEFSVGPIRGADLHLVIEADTALYGVDIRPFEPPEDDEPQG